MTVRQTVKYEAGHGVTAYLFGRPLSWRTNDRGARARVGPFLADIGIRTVYAIRASEFNAKIVSLLQFKMGDMLPGGVSLYLGPMSDGIENLHQGSACWIASADCPTVILTDGIRVVVFHAGLKSVYKMCNGVWILQSEQPGVVSNAVRTFAPGSIIHARIICGTRSLMYSGDDPKWGASNRQLHELLAKEFGEKALTVANPFTGVIMLQSLIAAQLMANGVSKENIVYDGFDTVTDRVGPGDEFLWHSNVRGGRGRNCVLIVRR
jgi:hypothetical protein